MSILTVENITKVFGEKTLFRDVSLGIDQHDKIGVIGINGTGKSTLLKIIAGLEEPDEGQIIKSNQAKISYLPQTPVFPQGRSILDYVTAGKENSLSGWSVEAEAKSILNKLGFSDYDCTTQHLSGGEKKRVALAECLVAPADILILDEPTNHLDSSMVMWLEDYLIRFKGTVIMVTHDRYFLDRVTNKIVEIDLQQLFTYESNYSGFLELKNKRIEEMLSAEQKRKNTLRRELEWVRRGAQARSTKQKARLQRYEELKNVQAPKLDAQVEMDSVYSRMGRKTIELQHISKSYGDRTLISDFTYSALRNDRLGIVGENGCGKSTLLKIIQGLVAPDTGSVAIGDTIQIGYFAQECRELEEVSQNEKVIDYIRDTAEFIETSTGTASASQMLERFLFTGAMQWTPIYKLSGGEKRRLYLLKVLMTAPNVLILDEPTNDLDIATLTILEDFLNSFQGIVITVSHDRYFLDNVADRILAFEAGGVIRQYDGNYSDYLEKSGYVPGNLRKNPEESPNPGQKSQASAKDTWKVKEERPKFSYKEQREYDTIEDEIGSLEERLSEIDAAMLEHASNYGRLNELTQEKEALEEELLVKMERWEYLSELAERIEEYKKNK